MMIKTIAEAAALVNRMREQAIELPNNGKLVFTLSSSDFHDLVEETGRTWKIQKSMLRSEAIEMTINSIQVQFKKAT